MKNLIVLDPGIKRLQDEGYRVEIQQGHLLVHSIPYVNAQQKVARGILITDLSGNVGELAPPNDHQVWFVGELPCYQNGSPMVTLPSGGQSTLWPGFIVNHRFSNKPFGVDRFSDYYSKMKHYIIAISNQARAIDPDATACLFDVIQSVESESPFRYWDTASSRANILPVTAKLAMNKIAIVGLGGTGSYVLDLVSKTPVKEIHLFDGDVLSQHNVFRSPGAASISDLKEKMSKVQYFSRTYSNMRRGVIPHNELITESNIIALDGFDFVFLCVDKGVARKLIGNYLRDQGIPFIDVGMGIRLCSETYSLSGICRTTMVTPDKSDHFEARVPLGKDDHDDVYASNIQVADMNCLNATLAVFKWKQFCGFYADYFGAHHTSFTVYTGFLDSAEKTRMTSEKEETVADQ